MKALGISRYVPDPLRACQEAEKAQTGMSGNLEDLTALIRHLHDQHMRHFSSDMAKLRVTWGDRLTSIAYHAALGAKANEPHDRPFPCYDRKEPR